MNKRSIVVILIFCLIMLISIVIPISSQAKDVIYREPTVNPGEDKGSLDDLIKDAESFESENGGEAGKSSSSTFELNQGLLQNFSSNLYSIILVAATAVSVIVGIVIGIKYMIGSVEEKAEYKKMLLPYVVGCVVIYGALGIWKIVISILEAI